MVIWGLRFSVALGDLATEELAVAKDETGYGAISDCDKEMSAAMSSSKG